MDRPDDPPGPENVGALLFLLVFGSALVPLYYLSPTFDFTMVDCAEQIQIAPSLLAGGLCGLLSTTFVALPLMALAGLPRRAAIEEDDDGLSWKRPRVSSRLLIPLVLAVPITLGAAFESQRARSFGTQCNVSHVDLGTFDSETYKWNAPSEATCLDPGFSVTVRDACRRSWMGFATQSGGLLLFWVLMGLAAVRTWRQTRDIELDEVGVRLNGHRIAYVDIDAVWCSDRELVFQTFDNVRHTVRLRPDEVPFARYVAQLVEPLLPPDELEDRPEERARLAALATER